MVGFLHVFFRFCAFSFFSSQTSSTGPKRCTARVESGVAAIPGKNQVLESDSSVSCPILWLFQKGMPRDFAKHFWTLQLRKTRVQKKPWAPRKQHHALQIHYKRHLDGEREGKLNAAQPSAPAGGFEGPKRAEIMDSE